MKSFDRIMNNFLTITLIAVLSCFTFVITAGCGKGDTQPTASIENDGSNENSGNTTLPYEVQEIINDSSLPHEGIPSGVPDTWDWHDQPVIKNRTPFSPYRDVTNWVQFYETQDGNPATNTRVQIRNLKTFYLDTDHIWHPIQNTCSEAQGQCIDGGWFAEDFSAGPFESNMRTEDEGISATAGNGTCFHAWTRDRGTFPDTRDVNGIYVTVEARLITDDPSKPDDRNNARYILSAGADFYTQSGNIAEPSMESIPAGTGRFKFVRNDWRTFTFCTVPGGVIENYPPPY